MNTPAFDLLRLVVVVALIVAVICIVFGLSLACIETYYKLRVPRREADGLREQSSSAIVAGAAQLAGQMKGLEASAKLLVVGVALIALSAVTVASVAVANAL